MEDSAESEAMGRNLLWSADDCSIYITGTIMIYHVIYIYIYTYAYIYIHMYIYIYMYMYMYMHMYMYEYTNR